MTVGTISLNNQTNVGATAWPAAYIRLSDGHGQNRSMAAWLSPQMDDPGWDSFLQSSALGQYQQSSLWARAKAAEGWEPVRIIFSQDGQMAGGFQILVRRSRAGKIGYVSKGPVLALEDSDWANYGIDTLCSTAREHGLQALILQPPDRSGLYKYLTPGRFPLLANHLVKVVSSTLLVDLSGGMEPIRQRIRKQTKVEIRQAEKRGIRIREGGEQDIGTFFRLMLATCERQQTRPNPPTEEALLETWRAFHAAGCARLSFSEFEGESVAGGLCLAFGDTVTIWKKGWSGLHRERHPNQPLLLDAVEWAQRKGCKFFDFASLRADIAATMLQNQPLSEEQRKYRDYIHLNYGNVPLMLPESRVYIRNPLAQAVYRLAIKIPPVRTRLRQMG